MMSSLPLPPKSPISPRSPIAGRSTSGSNLPPPPNIVSPHKGQQSNYAQNLSRSMTIDEMRELHRRALSDAEAKQTELRLVLASRYRELVGSSDEVTKMRERSQELHELVNALPELMDKLKHCANTSSQESKLQDVSEERKESTNKELMLRQELATLPRMVHRALDKDHVHQATVSLLKLFAIIAEQTKDFPLATALASTSVYKPLKVSNNLLQAQMKMTFLHVQTLPSKISRISRHILDSAASFGTEPKFGAQKSAEALSTLDLLKIEDTERTGQLLDLYFDSKAKLLQSLLSKLNISNSAQDNGGTGNTEDILSKIVLILQYDIILNPYQVFVLRNFPCAPSSESTVEGIMKSLPMFPAMIVQSKVSNFLAAHLPLIRTKVKSVLIDIAGTTASALGKIRQSLYDKTDGLECMERLDNSGVCTWDEAVRGVVDVQNVLSSSHGVGGAPMAYSESGGVDSSKFSLWSVLFSNTFSSLVHSLLTTSFQSVHSRVVSTLRESLANAPPLSSILPHEAYRNTLFIATELDSALLKVSDDAHELLVHAEERVESERRLRQSLYVQTCEIMGRLLSELRRMLRLSDNSEAVKDLIVGRLCHLLKYRLTALPTLLDPNSSPAVLHGTSGMISFLELSSAFDLADDNDDGLITFQEAMEAVDSAFSGTQFHGAEMVRETLLLPTSGEKDRTVATAGTNGKNASPQDVTLNELTLLLARGLRHENLGHHSALGTIQESLDEIIDACFSNWAKDALRPSQNTLSNEIKKSVVIISATSEEEYKRMYAHSESPLYAASMSGAIVGSVSPHISAFILELSSVLNRSICPSDSLLPVPSTEYAKAMGIVGDNTPPIIDMFRWALIRHGLDTFASLLSKNIRAPGFSLSMCQPSGLIQLKNDLSFIKSCFFERNKYGFGKPSLESESKRILAKLDKDVVAVLRKVANRTVLAQIEEKRRRTFEVCDLFLSSLFGVDSTAAVPLGDFGDVGQGPISGTNSLYHPPLPSSCRFPLLPIQVDRALSGVQARSKFKDKNENESEIDSKGKGAVRAGLGFFSSMLKSN